MSSKRNFYQETKKIGIFSVVSLNLNCITKSLGAFGNQWNCQMLEIGYPCSDISTYTYSCRVYTVFLHRERSIKIYFLKAIL